jgi:uncharacterized membrane protein
MLTRRGARAIFAVIAMSPVLVAVDAAHAFQTNVTFCNRTIEALTVAAGYDAAGTAKTTSRG